MISKRGKPNIPKIKMKFNIILITFEKIDMYIAGLVKPKPSINCLNV